MIDINVVSGGSIQANSYILEENNNIILIDFVPELESIIKENNYKIEKLLLTHTHFDHSEGLADFQKKYTFDVFLANEGFEYLQNSGYELFSMFPPKIIDNYKNIQLDRLKVVNDNEIVGWDNHNIRVLKSPGHSPDCLMYILDDLKCVFTGDTIFYGSVGRTDLPGGNFDIMLDSINKLFNKVSDDYKLYPGHGPPTTVYFEKKNNPFI